MAAQLSKAKQRQHAKKRAAQVDVLARLEGRPAAELVRSAPATTPWLVLLNASYDAGIDGAALVAALAPLAGFVRAEMHLGSRPYSFALFASPEEAEAACEALDGAAVPAWGGKTALVALAAAPPRGLPPRPLADPAAAASAVPGITLFAGFVESPDEEAALLTSAEAAGRAGRWESLAQRRVQHFGFRFDYPLNDVDRAAIDPAAAAADPTTAAAAAVLPDWTHPLLDRYTRMFPDRARPDQLTLNHYTPGGGIAPHTDRHSSFLSPVLIVSLGAGLVMEFRTRIRDAPPSDSDPAGSSSNSNGADVANYGTDNNAPDPAFRTVNIYLPPRSLVVMDAEARYGWEHAIRPRKMDLIDGLVVERRERWSLTFRNVRQRHDPPCTCGFTALCD
ncbi:hypothetical protein HK105_207248 [Polyrhizophydium stewartii]|uniref:Fe2OG dioxygenase domain-containing protein n=1 Tax=Polyrhizophydium stewartii TaxID=2732419 RepID=A0ABR4N1B5_9FUNG|nr:Alkylated DNA repair protein alkB 8 [Polyrhizophydium stewartii]